MYFEWKQLIPNRMVTWQREECQFAIVWGRVSTSRSTIPIFCWMDTINPKSCVHLAECRVRLFCANVPEAGVRFQLGERVPRCERAPESARRPIFHEIEQVDKGVEEQTGSPPYLKWIGESDFSTRGWWVRRLGWREEDRKGDCPLTSFIGVEKKEDKVIEGIWGMFYNGHN